MVARARLRAASARSSCSRSSSRTATGPWSSATPTRSGSCASPSRCATQPLRAGDSLLLDARSGYVFERIPKAEVEELVLEEVPDIAYERHRRARRPDRADPRRRRAAVPARRTCSREHELAAAEGHPALRPARLRQDADRQGGRQLAGQEGRRAHRRERGPHRYFLNIKGPELLNKYVGETERHIRLVFQRAREKAERGHAGHRLLRRDGLAVPHPRLGHLLRRRDHDRAAAAREIDGVEGLENVIVIGASNREDLIDPAILRPGPPRREDQDRAARRRGRRATSSPSTSPPTCRSTPTTSPSTAATPQATVRGDDPARRSSGCTPRRGEPVPRGHLRRTATRRSSTSRTSTPAP